MRRLTDVEAREWCIERGFVVDLNFPTSATLRDHEGRKFRVRIPDEATATVGMAYVLLMSGVREYVEAHFDGAVVWLRRWELWSETIDRVGESLLEGVIGAVGRAKPLGETPGLLCTERELVPAHASLALSMLFQWDAFYCPEGGQFLASVSHHGHLDVITSPDTFGLLFHRFSAWHPEAG
jgi:hypothetical protein